MSQYEWWTDPSGGRHFGRVNTKPVTVAKVSAVVSAPLAEAPKPAPKKKAPAKKKSDG
jgi:hypothetical protein